ncbi:hypothetical protein VTL71DRAFT_12195 [Oculimacula yallundae]|uniref:Uncharacterized protein n=1 Tax=Oculimacula yallundae TaxID=86028 RepID=A0ABR4CSS7_9HELO
MGSSSSKHSKAVNESSKDWQCMEARAGLPDLPVRTCSSIPIAISAICHIHNIAKDAGIALTLVVLVGSLLVNGLDLISVLGDYGVRLR